MNHKELDIALGRHLTSYFVQHAFSGRGHQTARRWERDSSNGDVRQVIVTPFAPIRSGGGLVSCGVGIRFETIETELAQLTAGSICFSPSGDTSTIGAPLEKIVQPGGGILRWQLSDETSIQNACQEIEHLLTVFALPWLNEMQTYTSAYHFLLNNLTTHPKENCVTTFRLFLLGAHLGVELHEVVLRSLEQAIVSDEIGADVCRRILEQT